MADMDKNTDEMLLANLALGAIVLGALVHDRLEGEAKKLEGVKAPDDVTEELRASVMHPMALAYLAGADDTIRALATCSDSGVAEGTQAFEKSFSELNFRMELLRMGVD